MFANSCGPSGECPRLQRFARLTHLLFGGASPPPTVCSEAIVGEVMREARAPPSIEHLTSDVHEYMRSHGNMAEVQALRHAYEVERQQSSSLLTYPLTEADESMIECRCNTLFTKATEKATALHQRARVKQDDSTMLCATALVPTWMQLGDSEPFFYRYFAPEGDGGYQMLTLASVAESVAGYLHLMDACGVAGQPGRITELTKEGGASVCSNFPEDLRGAFGALELHRHLIALRFCSSADAVATVAMSSACVESLLKDSVSLTDKFLDEQRQAAVAQQLMTSPQQLCGHYLAVLQDYSTFFNVAFALTEGLCGCWESFALSFSPRGGRLYGSQRFPCVQGALFAHNRAGKLLEVSGRNAVSGQPLTALCPVLSPLAGSVGQPARSPSYGQMVMPTATSDYVTSFFSLVTTFFAPASSFGTLLALAAVASLPLQEALDILILSWEVQSLLEGNELVVAMIMALWRGNIGTAWQYAQRSALHYLRCEILVSSSLLNQLLVDVRSALCFQYVSIRSTVVLTRAASHLHLDSPDELREILERLIIEDKLSARINRIAGVLTEVVPLDQVCAEAKRAQTLQNSDISIKRMELVLRLFSLERALTSPLGNAQGHARMGHTTKKASP